MKIKLLMRWGGNDRANAGDVIEVTADQGAHLILRHCAVLPDEPLPPKAAIVEPIGDDLDPESRALVAADNAEAIAAAEAKAALRPTHAETTGRVDEADPAAWVAEPHVTMPPDLEDDAPVVVAPLPTPAAPAHSGKHGKHPKR